jgi:hypothetical protein
MAGPETLKQVNRPLLRNRKAIMKKIFMALFSLTLIQLTIALAGDKCQAQGASRAIGFSGTSHVNMGDSLSKALAQSDFTIETWIKIRSNTSDPVFIGNKDWANGANTGIVWCRYTTANTIRFNFRASGRTRKDLNITYDYTKWNHIAITVKRNGTMTGYLNGIQQGTPVSIATDSGYTLHANLPFRVGADGNGAYPINGDMDELRIWNNVRTETEIRNNMCRKIDGASNGLLAYYRMDETTGNTLVNAATASTGNFNGTFVSTPSRIASGAAIGDTAVNFYGSTFTGQVLNLSSTANGSVQINNMDNNMQGLHLYQVNAVPNTTSGIPNPGTNNVYYGVFPVADTVSYTATYNYTNYPAANTFEGGLDLFNRYAVDSSWTLWGAVKNTTANTLTKTNALGREEMILGSFVTSVTCNVPTALNARNITTNAADLSWITGGSNLWNIRYGAGTFNPATGGTKIANLSASAYTVTGLTANTTYTFYVQDSCVALNNVSGWAGPYSFTTAMDYSAYGSGYSINFQGTNANEHVNLGDSLSGALATTNFTLETWIRFDNPSSDPSFIGNKNWASGANTGILWCWNGNGNLRFNFKPANGLRRDYDINVPDPAEWNHIAMVVDRKGNLTAYLNGIQAGTPINIAVDSGKTLDGTLPIRIGQDGTGIYGPKFRGGMDELRIWNKTLSAAEIRANICRKVNGADTNLMAYYRMDETAGNVLTNIASRYGAVFNGALMNNPQLIVSGAAIGDTSITIYPSGWANTSLSLSSAANGSLTIDSVESNTSAVHIYRLNSAPNYTNGIAQIGGTNQYFGVFTPGNKKATYRMVYNYANYPNAVSNSARLHLYNRNTNADTLWIQSPAVNTVATTRLTQYQPMGVAQVLLADFSVAACPTPSAVVVNNVDTGNATISWTSAAGKHFIEFGDINFVLGTGTKVITTGTSTRLNNLNASQSYKFYMKDSCGANSQSVWVGPFYFTTLNPCPKPQNIVADSITATSIVVKWDDNGVVTQDYLVSWGATGFGNPAFGIQTTVTGKRYELTSASANTSYDFYIRANCNSSVSNSGWVGPFTFTTLPCDIAGNVTTTAITASGAKATWTSTATAWKIQYGVAGFNLGTGTLVPGLAIREYTFAGLSANANYEFYIQDSCNAGLSTWAGPYAFKTAQSSSVGEVSGNYAFKAYPNPADNNLTIYLPENKKTTNLVLRNNVGAVVYQAVIKGDKLEINTATLPTGMYFLTVNNATETGTRKVMVQH